LEPPTEFSSDLLNPSIYFPGFPSDGFPPVIHVFEYANPFFDQFEDSMLDETGIFQLKESEPKKMPFIRAQQPKKPPEKVEFLIKWQGTPADQAPWETPERLLHADPGLFSIANASEFPRLRDQYWIRIDPQFVIPPVTGRLNRLYSEQRSVVDWLLQQKDSVVLTGEPGSGRIATVCGFLEFSRRPTLILVDSGFAWIWVKAIREITSLVWVEYNGNPQNRVIIRSQDFRTKLRFEILISTPEILAPKILDF
jgi:hypothetical protein